MPTVHLIAALSKDTRAIGADGKLLWHLPDDMAHFKHITSGHDVVMGRKTWESIPEKFRPLPDRHNIVITRQDEYDAPGATVCHSLAEAYSSATSDTVCIIGGQSIYEEALPQATKLYLTLVDEKKSGDTFFPEYSEFTQEISREEHEEHGIHYTWLTLERSV